MQNLTSKLWPMLIPRQPHSWMEDTWRPMQYLQTLSTHRCLLHFLSLFQTIQQSLVEILILAKLSSVELLNLQCLEFLRMDY